MTELIGSFDDHYLLGHEAMDATHREFVRLVNQLGAADKTEFAALLADLHAHTQVHFEQERQWMRESGFPAIREHLDEHQRILGELSRFAERASSGAVMMGKAYVTQQLPQWFELHARTMDSALAAHLKTHRP